MRTSRLLLGLVCGLVALLALGCPKSPPEDPNAELAAANKQRAENVATSESSADAETPKAAVSAADSAAENDVDAEEAGDEPDAADAEPATPDSTEADGSTAAESETAEGDHGEEGDAEAPATDAEDALILAWGTRGKSRPSQSGEDEASRLSDLRVVSGPLYTRLPVIEIDKLRAEEQSGDIPPSEMFGMVTIRTPFRKIDQKPPERGPHPELMSTLIDEPVTRAANDGPETAEPTQDEVAVADGGPGETTQALPRPSGAASSSQDWTTEPMDVPPTGTGTSQSEAGQIQAPVIVQDQYPQLTQQQRAELQRQAEVNAYFNQRFTPAQGGATRPAPRGSVNLYVAGTVVGNDGRATAILSDGTNSVWVQEGDQFAFEGRNVRVIQVAQEFVQVEDRQRRINLGVGGSSP